MRLSDINALKLLGLSLKSSYWITAMAQAVRSLTQCPESSKIRTFSSSRCLCPQWQAPIMLVTQPQQNQKTSAYNSE